MPFWIAWAVVAPLVAKTILGIDGRFNDRRTARATAHVVWAFATIYVVAAVVYAAQRVFALTDLELPIWQGAIAVAYWRVPTSVLVYVVLLCLVYLQRPVARMDLSPPKSDVESVSADSPETTAAPEAQSWLTRLVVKGAGRMTLVAVDEIDWIEAADYCVRVHAGARTHMLRDSMTSLEAKLDPARFVRVHRSAIVNLDRVREIQKSFQREHIVILRDGTRVVLSAARRPQLEALLRNTL